MPIQSPTIRPASIDDAHSIASLSRQLGYPASKADLEDRLASLLSDPDHAVFVALLGTVVVGWIHVFVAHRVESETFAEIGGFVVDQRCRRRRIGRVLLAVAEDWAKEKAVRKLRVRSRSEREDARGFYESLGFTAIKEQRVFDKQL